MTRATIDMKSNSKFLESMQISAVDRINPAHMATHASRQNRGTSAVNVAPKVSTPIRTLSK